ncbi:MAG TPA: hypothetical protein VF315_01370, partial [Steroidobacteraceae bacterium]
LTALAPHFSGDCRGIALGASAADVAVDRARRLAYLTYLDRSGEKQGKPALGTVMLVDLNVPTPRPRAALSADPPAFSPQAISLYTPPSGPQRLFVISRARAGRSTIEILEQTSTGAFAPLETLHDPLLVAPRAILAVGPRQFYVANESAGGGRLQRLADLLWRRARSSVDYFDGKTMRSVVTQFGSGTGIAASPDLAHVYVSEAFARRVVAYTRDAASGELRIEHTVDLASMPGQISVDESGTLWVAAQPKTLAYLRHLRNPSRPAPAQVFSIPPATWQVKEEYLDLGGQLSAASVAALVGKTLLIGAAAEHKMLLCQPSG